MKLKFSLEPVCRMNLQKFLNQSLERKQFKKLKRRGASLIKVSEVPYLMTGGTSNPQIIEGNKVSS